MPRAIDHVVHASRDLAGQAELYKRLGFTIGSRNHHPWGTENHIVQFPGHFLELIGVGPGFRPPEDPDPRTFSFAGFICEQLAEREGLSMLALQSSDAVATRADFKAAQVGDFEPFHFERKGKRPDGGESHVAFTLTFARSSLMPAIGFFACQHHHPEEFFASSLQQHPNGATGIAGIVVVAENPASHGEFLSGLTGQREMLATSMGIDLEVAPGQSMEILTPVAFVHRFGEAALGTGGAGPRLCACRIAVRDLDVVADLLDEAGIAAATVGHRLIVPPSAAMGAALAFEAVTD
ncbi:MAG: glyoxalase [Hyphomicrobiales bacterium]|nr:glyoxalase [Hyphomicrobiales bacterium]